MLLFIPMILCSMILLLRVILCTVAFQLRLLVALLPPLMFHAAFLTQPLDFASAMTPPGLSKLAGAWQTATLIACLPVLLCLPVLTMCLLSLLPNLISHHLASMPHPLLQNLL